MGVELEDFEYKVEFLTFKSLEKHISIGFYTSMGMMFLKVGD